MQKAAHYLMKNPALCMLRLYKRCISPLLPPACRYYPTCSAYAMTLFAHENALLASYHTLLRLLRCNALFAGGLDFPRVSVTLTLDSRSICSSLGHLGHDEALKNNKKSTFTSRAREISKSDEAKTPYKVSAPLKAHDKTTKSHLTKTPHETTKSDEAKMPYKTARQLDFAGLRRLYVPIAWHLGQGQVHNAISLKQQISIKCYLIER